MVQDIDTIDLDAAFDDDFDPLAGPDFDADDDVDFPIAEGGAEQAEASHARPVPEHDPRPASERIAELFSEMPNRRKTLFAILGHCGQARPVREVVDFISELKLHDKSVYTANDFTTLLQRCGALERVGEDGQPYVEVDLEPETVVVDGVEYLQPQTPPPAFWRTTQAGADYLASDDPDARLQEVFEQEGDYLPIFRRILTLCLAHGGADAKAIASAVDGDPLLAHPRYYSSRFVEKLKNCDALAWEDKTWVVTDLGRVALDQLSGVADPASDKIAEGAR